MFFTTIWKVNLIFAQSNSKFPKCPVTCGEISIKLVNKYKENPNRPQSYRITPNKRPQVRKKTQEGQNGPRLFTRVPSSQQAFVVTAVAVQTDKAIHSVNTYNKYWH